MIDIQGRSINYLRVSLTDKCNLNCRYCMPKGICNDNPIMCKMSIKETDEIIKAFSELGVNKIRFTGGEPLIVKNIEEIIYNTSRIKGVSEISLTTNGVFLADKVEALKAAGLTRVNVSMDTLNDEKYKKITGKLYLPKVKEGIKKSLQLGITPMKINVVIMKDVNLDELEAFIDLTRNYEVEVRFIELMPIGSGIDLFRSNFISAKDIINKHPELIKVNHENSSTAEIFKVKDGKGRIGFIAPLSCKFCSECNRIRLTSQGKIKTCLHSEDELDILPFVRQAIHSKNKDEYIKYHNILKREIEGAVFNKPIEHTLLKDGKSKSHRSMFEIGG